MLHKEKLINRLGEERALKILYSTNRDNERPEESRAAWRNALEIEQFYVAENQRKQGDILRDILQNTDFEFLGDRIANCALRYNRELNPKYCQNKKCPICHYKRSVKWQHRFESKFCMDTPAFEKNKWVHCQLDAGTYSVYKLRDAIQLISQAFHRFMKLKKFPALGYIRTLNFVWRENELESIKIVVNILMLVQPSRFSGKSYVGNKEFLGMWKQSLRTNQNLDVKIYRLKNPTKTQLIKILWDSTIDIDFEDFSLSSYVDFVKQTFKQKTISTGGIIREEFRQIKTSAFTDKMNEFKMLNNQKGYKVRNVNNNR